MATVKCPVSDLTKLLTSQRLGKKAKPMKCQILTIAIGLLAASGIRAEPPAKITFGTPIRKEFPADGQTGRSVYIELPVTITNTSKFAIQFVVNCGPEFNVYVQRKTNSKQWFNITPRGMCGVGAHVQTLAPGEALKDTQLITLADGGHGYRLELPLREPGTGRMSSTKITSEKVLLPKIKD